MKNETINITHEVYTTEAVEEALLALKSRTLVNAHVKRSNFNAPIHNQQQDEMAHSSVVSSPFSHPVNALGRVSGTDSSDHTLSNTTSVARVPLSHRRPFPSSLYEYQGVSDPLDTKNNMKTMDLLFDATFSDFIRNEENVLVIARHLASIALKHHVHVVSNGLRWFLEGWSLESVAKLLKLMTREWSPLKAGTLINLLSYGWSVNEANAIIHESSSMKNACVVSFNALSPSEFYNVAAMSRLSRHSLWKLVAIMMAGEDPIVAAKFIKSLTCSSNWDSEGVTELISFLDAVLEWDETYFKGFTQEYIRCIKQEIFLCGNENIDPEKVPIVSKISFDYLAALYKTNLALANYRLALVDFRMAASNRAPGEKSEDAPVNLPKEDEEQQGVPLLSHEANSEDHVGLVKSNSSSLSLDSIGQERAL